MLVEGPRLRVALEDPQPEAIGAQLLDEIEEGAARSLAVQLGIDVQVVEKVVAEGEEADHPPVVLGDPDLVVLGHHALDPGKDLLGAVRVRQVGHALPARSQMDVSQRGRILGGRPPDRKLH